MNMPFYHEDLQHFHVNTLPNLAYFVPFSSIPISIIPFLTILPSFPGKTPAA